MREEIDGVEGGELFSRFLPFWDRLSEEEKALIQTGSHQMNYKKGTQMLQCEQGCNGIMIILSGQIRTFLVSEEGREVTLFRVFQDDVCVMSAAGLLDAIAFDVMFDSVEDSTVMMIPVQVLGPVIRKYPEAEAYLYRTAVERFSDVLWVMQQILFRSVDRRLGQFLWDEITRSGSMVIALTHDEIARYIGSAREVVTKVLKYFQSEGVLTLGRGKITVESKEKLKKYI